MLRKFTWLLLLLAITVGVFSFRSLYYSLQPPSNYSGTPGGGLCSDCHGNLNSGGGSVQVTGLPASFSPGKTYPFSLTITHGMADRRRWGFEINARNTSDMGIGTFSSTNPNAAINGDPSEIAHFGAVVTPPSGSYTYSGLSWTAPSTINSGDNAVTFYIAGNAANANGDPSGDFIYSNTLLFVLPISLKNFDYKIIDNKKVQLNWQTAAESNSKEFILEKSDDNNRFYEAGRIAAAGNSTNEKSYSFLDEHPSFYSQPVYYRLKLVDLDGKFRYSKVITFTLPGKTNCLYSLSPNPATDHLMAGISSETNQAVEATIISATGNVVRQLLLQVQKGSNTYKVGLPPLQHGLYFLRLQNRSFNQQISFVAMH
jgi:hypothetical protein